LDSSDKPTISDQLWPTGNSENRGQTTLSYTLSSRARENKHGLLPYYSFIRT
jgi:hypothetical protein